MQRVVKIIAGIIFSFSVSQLVLAAPDWEIVTKPSNDADCVTMVGGKGDAVLLVDEQDYPVVQIAANFFADDVQRVTGHRLVVTNTPASAPQAIIAGTLGHSALIDRLVAGGKLAGVNEIQNHWETTLAEIVQNPFPGVQRALVIVGSDRRGTAYGLMQLSEKIGVSPWYWWADVPARRRDSLAIKVPSPQMDSPAVKYRGIFINDEDWGLNPWASKTFDPEFKNIGPKTYEKVFELMLRLRLNYIWPAMHACSAEFGSVPENAALADKFGIVAGSSHCEPMLCNNIHWNETNQGRWNYSLNRDTIHSYWGDTAKARGTNEAVWTLGIRGIHDRAMETPPTKLADKIKLVTQVIQDQRDLLNQYAGKEWGPVAQCFVPYKEVLPIYDAGLNVPPDVTLVWVDDNFGYIRRLSNPEERQRAGGAGIYWHISYYGSPHSYTWINTTAPALMWEELHKAWENDARTLWVLNVGDIKPMEIGIDYFSRLAWNPDGFPLGAQWEFLHEFAAKNFGEKTAKPMADLLMDFYRLGTVRKPELMNRDWAMLLPPERAAQLDKDYRDLLTRGEKLARAVPDAERDAYMETIGFPARVLGDTGLIFMMDRKVRQGADFAACERQIAKLRSDLEVLVGDFNTNIAGGKWNRMMPGPVTGTNLTEWNSQVRWPWGEKRPAFRAQNRTVADEPPAGQSWRDAAALKGPPVSRAGHSASWTVVDGLGPSGHAVALKPTSPDASFKTDDETAPTLAYEFKSGAGDSAAYLDFLPTFRLYPGMKLRVAVSVDANPFVAVEVPGSSGAENENGTVRSLAVQNNYVRLRVPMPGIASGRHVFRIRAIDPGVVIDRISLP